MYRFGHATVLIFSIKAYFKVNFAQSLYFMTDTLGINSISTYFVHIINDALVNEISSCIMKTIEIRVTGQVQGVFFRKSTLEKATALGINGTVKNKKDGSVEIIASGNDDQLGKILLWCLEGSASAKVHKVTFKELDTESSVESFEIIY